MAHHFDERKLVGAFAADNKDVACLQVSTLNVDIFNGTHVYTCMESAWEGNKAVLVSEYSIL